ncbi:hypothetical protein ACFVG1_12770 [Streptomyces bacillaris]|uniref:hypothetical protein n=1 Tax=Streptomyces bacillaris TaxID=68179 RepID=UPI0035DAB99D
MTEQETTHQGPGVYGGMETHRGHRHECPAPDCGPQGARIVPNDPGDDEGVTIHLPQVDYVDTQVWSVDVGVGTDTLRELRDAIDNHLGISTRSDVGTEFVQQADHPDEAALAAFEADPDSSTAPKGGSKGDAPHAYLSTGCLHGEHAYCQSMTGQQGEKRPGRCKFCDARCTCPCHGETEGTA